MTVIQSSKLFTQLHAESTRPPSPPRGPDPGESTAEIARRIGFGQAENDRLDKELGRTPGELRQMTATTPSSWLDRFNVIADSVSSKTETFGRVIEGNKPLATAAAGLGLATAFIATRGKALSLFA